MRFILIAAIAAALFTGCGESERVPAQETSDAVTVSSRSVRPNFGDFDPRSWPGRTPQSYPIHGIDVSRWQGVIDWHRVRSAGVTFAFLKATEGGDIVDPMFSDYWKGSRDAGIRRGAYHFFYFCRPAVDQARWFIENVPQDASALPHVLDMEWNPHSPTCRIRPDGATVRAEAKRFLDLLETHYGHRPIIYTTVDFYRDTGIGELKRTDFWLRSVADHPSETYPGADWLFWQYSGTGRVPGIEGPVDLNAFRSTPSEWSRWST